MLVGGSTYPVELVEVRVRKLARTPGLLKKSMSMKLGNLRSLKGFGFFFFLGGGSGMKGPSSLPFCYFLDY